MLILASESPRRKEILEELGIEFEVMPTRADENVEALVTPSEYVSIVSKRKAASAVETCIRNNIKKTTIIAADTVVCIDDKILGKPRDREDAISMLKLLENNWHSVYTGLSVAFIDGGRAQYVQDCCLTRVKFKPLTDRQIEEYVDTGEPYDKAGSYGIQGIGRELIDELDGDYHNVVGLPVKNLMSILGNFIFASNGELN